MKDLKTDKLVMSVLQANDNEFALVEVRTAGNESEDNIDSIEIKLEKGMEVFKKYRNGSYVFEELVIYPLHPNLEGRDLPHPNAVVARLAFREVK